MANTPQIVTNLSQMAREIDYLPVAIFNDVGEAIAEGLMEEFEQLVNETAQRSGTTAASWNISLGGVGTGGGVRTYPEPKDPAEWLSKGHQEAVQRALTENAGALDGLATMGLPGQKGNRYKAVMIENYAPGAEQSEFGPIREANQPTGAFERFKMRAANHLFKVRDRKI